jgi:hypothetical protein
MQTDPTQSMMEELPHYKSKYDAAKKINVYFIPAFDEDLGNNVYFYVIASAALHEQMLSSLQKGDIPHFAVIVEKGVGEPSIEVKSKIKDYYGFDHDYYASNDNRIFPRTGAIS